MKSEPKEIIIMPSERKQEQLQKAWKYLRELYNRKEISLKKAE